MTSTALGLLLNLHFSAASVITDIAGGQIYNRFGGELLFQGGAVIGGLWCMFMLGYFACGGWRKERGRDGYETLVDATGSIQAAGSIQSVDFVD